MFKMTHEEKGLFDEYAGQALAGMLAGNRCPEDETIQGAAFYYAETMIKERRRVLGKEEPK